ncbi:MAG TPA: hypothetical protein VMF11_12205 [Candidatus Baltobacteraceae bacterium]|nr:hypothetical protein [Candidatus Baltobacteraceae bacterium]
MSGLDPLAALAAQAVANAQTAMDETILNLAADVAVLQAQINVGEVLAAVVLPPAGGTDLLSFLGQTVAAQIPPGINPGETMLLQVTGFTNSAVIVRNLGTLDPDNPVPTVNVEIPPPVTTDGPQSAILTTNLTPQAAPVTNAPTSPQNVPVQNVPAQNAPVQSGPPQSAPVAPARVPPANLAPPREVFVAASVRPNLAATARALAGQIDEAIARNDVEARIALNRASTQPAPPAIPSNATPRQSAMPSTPAAAPPAQNAPPRTGSFPVAPPIVRASANTGAAAPARPPVPETAESALLTRLRIPITPVTLAAARTISTAAENVTTSYERLESLLSKLMPQASGTLRSVLAFAGRMDLRNADALREQIATFVSDVLDGAEAKIVQLVKAWSELPEAANPLPVAAEEESAPPSQAPVQAQTPASTQPQAASQTQAAVQEPAAPPAPEAGVAVNAVATAAERTVALDYDVKSAILTMIAASERGDSPQIAGALRDALTATTALQLNVLSAQSSDPRTIAIPLPAYFHDGGAPVQLRISRDAPQGKSVLDADNFHIAFVLDTNSLGTVAIDLQTVGRAVTVEVKTQAGTFADRFRSTLGDLRSRLEGLHYRVAAIGAAVAGAAESAPAPANQTAAAPDRRSFWDTRA